MNIANCPICGFPFGTSVDEDELRNSYWICSCCGCEYGVDDTLKYRESWLANGARWFMGHPPQGWDVQEQLKMAIPDWENPLLPVWDGGTMEAYCVTCKGMKEMKDPTPVVMKNGKPGVTGACADCGTEMFKAVKSA